LLQAIVRFAWHSGELHTFVNESNYNKISPKEKERKGKSVYTIPFSHLLAIYKICIVEQLKIFGAKRWLISSGGR
jgi:hypothetical protein